MDGHRRNRGKSHRHILQFGIDNANIGVYRIDETGIILYANLHAAAMLGYAVQELTGMSLFEIDTVLTPEAFREHRARTRQRRMNTIQSVQRRKDGSVFPVEVTVSYFTLGKIQGSFSFVQDITERKEMLDSLIAAKEKAEESDRLKSSFLMNMSHEIRTPMNGILGFLSLLSEPDLEEESKREYIEAVNRSGRRLLDTINDIIEISRIEAGEVTANPVPVDLSEVMHYLLEDFRPQATLAGLQLTLAQHVTGFEALVHTDRTLLERILENILRNAVKFTRYGGIEFGSTIHEGILEIFVKDSGIGIPLERQDAIFDRFVQSDIGLTRSHEGSGLGLTIAHAYAQALGATIRVDSTPGIGSTFTISMPYQHTNPASVTADDDRDTGESNIAAGMHILVAEDDPASYRYIEIVLSRIRARLTHAVNGEEAVRAFREGPRPALILMDIKMPGIDGLEATRRIRQIDERVPIIAQTAYTGHDDRERALDVGCTDYACKPIQRQELLRLVRIYTSNGTGG